MTNNFVLNNFDSVSRMLLARKSVPDEALRESLYKFIASPEKGELTHKAKKDYATLLLTGFVVETQSYNKDALKNIRSEEHTSELQSQ